MNSYSSLKGYIHFRLVISENNGGDNLSIAEWQLFGSEVTLSGSLMNSKGTISAQYNTMPHEGPAFLIDGNVESKYCSAVQGSSWWIRYESPEDLKVESYTLTSANDSPERDPIDWRFEGSVNGRSWDVLDTQKNQIFVGRFSTMEYPVNTDKVYSFFRVTVTKNNADKILQLAEWQLFGTVSPTGIGQTEIPAFRVFTDKDKMIIMSDSAVSGSYEVFSVAGQSVLKGEIGPGTTISETLKAGIYLVSLKSLLGNTVKKIIIK